MKKTFFMVAVMMLSFTFVFAKPTDYAGNWTLDTKQSKNLPPYQSRVKSHKLVIAQSEKTLNVAVEITADEAESNKFDFLYNLDGTESKTKTRIRTPEGMTSVPTRLKAEEAENGSLKITIIREVMTPDGEAQAITVENWQLSADGKTLKIHRIDNMPRGTVEMDMVFVKN